MPATNPIETVIFEADPEALAAARAARLVYVSDAQPGIRRKRSGTGFSYTDVNGKPLRDSGELRRIKRLAIPPAYEDVWICPDPEGHIQATGRDARGRKQYRYHPRWREVRDADKYEEMLTFGELLPALRARLKADLAKRGLPREKVLATVVVLLQTTLIRVGNEDYAQANKSYGLTTLRNRHVEIEGATLRFEFKGKSGKIWKLQLHDRRIARIVKACHDLPGQELFQYVDADGTRHGVSSGDVNAYLREITGEDITAKHFRTWAGTVLAAAALGQSPPAVNQTSAKRTISQVIKQVAARLGNTPTICRKCYVHPEVLAAFMEGEQMALVTAGEADPFALAAEEAALLKFLSRRLGRRRRLNKAA
jgi:DNA topoisomerase-1